MAEALPLPKDMKKFLVIWLGQLISLFGSGLTGFALAVWIFQETGQATPFAMTILFGNLPRLLLSPLAGSLADRWNRRLLMILSDAGSALVTLSIVFVIMSGELQIWHIYLIATFNAIFAAFQEPAYTASIAMIVPKKNLARANGMVQMGQALEMVATPLMAGVLFVAIGLRGIVLIDFASFFFAIGALLVVKIPQPEVEPPAEGERATVMKDVVFGWNYMRARAGLLGILIYFAFVNFLLNFAVVLAGPMVLSNNPPSVYGLVQMTLGAGLLAGGIVMSAWGGPQRGRIKVIIGFIILAAAGLVVTGLHPWPVVIGAGLLILTFSVPMASGPSQAIFQSKIAPAVQGRVFAIRSLVSRSMMPLAFLLAGPLADYVFEPMMLPGGALASSILGRLFGVGAGRGIALIYIISGVLLAAASFLAYANPRIRNVEEDLPDELPGEEAGPVTDVAAEPAAEPGTTPAG